MESSGFYNELMAFAEVIASAQRMVNGEASVWSDAQIQKALAQTDPNDPEYLWFPAELDAAYTGAMDRMYNMLKSATRRNLAQAGLDNAEDARQASQTRAG